METLYLVSGSKISRRDNTVCITPKDGKARLFPVESLKHIVNHWLPWVNARESYATHSRLP